MIVNNIYNDVNLNYSQKDYCNLLYKNLNGRIEIIKIDNGKVKFRRNFSSTTDIVSKLNDIQNDYDFYVSANSFSWKRTSSNCKELRCLYIDLDSPKKNLTYEDKTLWLKLIYQKVIDEKIPLPSIINWSGSGFHLYWKIEIESADKIYMWQEVEDYLYYQLKDLGADKKATDVARILRVPDTFNSKYKIDNKCKIIFLNNKYIYNLETLHSDLVCPTIRPTKSPTPFKSPSSSNSKHKINKHIKSSNVITYNMFNSYTLHIDRVEDIKTLVKLRDYKVKGYRNMLLHCYAYWRGIYIRDTDTLKNVVYDFNNSFHEPLKSNEVDNILRCIPKVIDNFISSINKERKNIDNVNMKNKKRSGYCYKNITLINKLDITEEEQKHLKTIISKREKYKRNNIKRKLKRRGTNNNTYRTNKKLELIKKIKELKGLKLTQLHISKQLNVCLRTVKTYWNI